MRRKFTTSGWWGDKGEAVKTLGSAKHCRKQKILDLYSMMLVYNNAHGITKHHDTSTTDTIYITKDLYRAPPP